MTIRGAADRYAYRPLFAGFIFSIMAFPFLLVEQKIVLGLIVMAFGFALGRGASLPAGYYIWSGIILLFYSLYVLIPITSGIEEQGSILYTTSLYIGFTLFWILFLPFIGGQLPALFKIAVISAWLIWLYAILILLGELGYVPFGIPDVYSLAGIAINVDTRDVGLSSNMVSSLLFTAPVLTFAYLKQGSLSRILLLGVFWIGILALGRRSAFLGLAVSALFYFWNSMRSPKAFKRAIGAGIVAILVASVVIKFDIADTRTLILNRLDSLSLENETERVDQTRQLLSDFTYRPWLGFGHGSSTNVIRSADKPWRYEMSIPASLFRYGILGYIVIWILVGGPALYCLWAFRSKLNFYQQSFMCGVFSQFLAYTLNPVFDSFDTAWQFFMPVLFCFQVSLLRSTKEALPLRNPVASGKT